MTDEYALEVFPDPAGEAVCGGVLDTLERAGVPTIRTQGHRPHLSLTLTLSAVGTFPGSEGVVYWAPTVTRELLDLHSRWFDNLRRHSTWFDAEPGREVEHRQYYLPGVWVPHLSLGINVPADRVGEAVSIVRAAGAVTLRLVAAALVHVPSGRATPV